MADVFTLLYDQVAMWADLQTTYVLLGIISIALGILATIFGWFGKFIDCVKKFFRDKRSSALIDIPKKTLVLLAEQRPDPYWWHMGRKDKQPGMQIAGNLRVTNISKYDILPSGVKMRNPKAVGRVLIKDVDSQYFGEYFIPKGAVTELTFDFWVQPPLKAEGKLFKADIAILDQFANEHWLKDVEFKYH